MSSTRSFDELTSPFLFAVKENSQHTIGVEFQSRTIQIGEKKVKLQVSESEQRERERGETSVGGAVLSEVSRPSGGTYAA